MVFGGKKRAQREAEIKEAEEQRDELRESTDKAIGKVDVLKDQYIDELTEQYRKASELNGGD